MHSPELQEPIEILLVEDNDADALLITCALRNTRIFNCLHRVTDGIEALEFLHQEGIYANAPRPHLILLDLNLPRKSGREVLAEVKADENLRTIPIIVLTASRSEDDILQVYAHYANCYINKPMNGEGFTVVAQSIRDFWFTVVTLPPHEYHLYKPRRT